MKPEPDFNPDFLWFWKRVYSQTSNLKSRKWWVAARTPRLSVARPKEVPLG